MPKETKAIVAFDESFAKLDVRVGRVTAVDLETRMHKPTYKIVVDFGKFGKRVSYGRFTNHPIDKENLIGRYPGQPLIFSTGVSMIGMPVKSHFQPFETPIDCPLIASLILYKQKLHKISM